MIVTSVSGIPGGPAARPGRGAEAPDGAARKGRAQHRAAQRRPARAQPAHARPARGKPARGGPGWPGQPGSDAETALFTRWVQDYAADRCGRPIAVLLAGAVTAASDLGLAGLRAGGADISAGLVDVDQPVTRAAVASQPALARCTLGDLRTVALPQRSFDIVACTLLLDRVEHAELVLDRLTGALKPGGLLLLQVRDRDCAAGFLDRMLPGWLRGVIWRQHRPGRPGPHPAVYEALSTIRGIQSYALLRGLVVVQRQPLGGLAGGLPSAPRGYLAAQQLVARFSRRLTASHEELLYVLRKPEHRFARLL